MKGFDNPSNINKVMEIMNNLKSATNMGKCYFYRKNPK